MVTAQQATDLMQMAHVLTGGKVWFEKDEDNALLIDGWMISLADYSFEQIREAIIQATKKRIYKVFEVGLIHEQLEKSKVNNEATLFMQYVMQKFPHNGNHIKANKDDRKNWQLEVNRYKSEYTDYIESTWGDVGISVHVTLKNDLWNMRPYHSENKLTPDEQLKLEERMRSELTRLFVIYSDLHENGEFDRLPYVSDETKSLLSSSTTPRLEADNA